MRKSIALAVVFVSAGAAQTVPVIRGEVTSQTQQDWHRLTILLEPQSHVQPASRGALAADGSFELHDVPYGTYMLHVMDDSRSDLTTQLVIISSAAENLSIRLPATPGSKVPQGRVTLNQLRHKPPKDAVQSARRAEQLAAKGDFEGAAAFARKAIDADPDFAEAHCNLGVQYVRLGRLADALAELRKAIELDPTVPLFHRNLGIVLARTDSTSAVSEFRRAVELDPSDPQSHLFLGGMLLNASATCGEALEHLTYAARDIPAARSILPRAQQCSANQKAHAAIATSLR